MAEGTGERIDPTLPLTAAAAATRTGPKHPVNEDQFRILDGHHPLVARLGRGSLFAVADGVSTTPRGREAAEIGCARISGFYDRAAAPRLETLLQIVSEIDWELRSGRKGEAACTLSLLWLAHGQATIVHVGDSQVYRMRHGEVRRLTRPKRGQGLTSFVGMGPRLAEVVEVWREPLCDGDLFLLVTDGVTDVVDPEEVIDLWWDGGGSPRSTVETVIREVERRGGQDDATILLVDVLGRESSPRALRTG